MLINIQLHSIWKKENINLNWKLYLQMFMSPLLKVYILFWSVLQSSHSDSMVRFPFPSWNCLLGRTLVTPPRVETRRCNLSKDHIKHTSTYLYLHADHQYILRSNSGQPFCHHSKLRNLILWNVESSYLMILPIEEFTCLIYGITVEWYHHRKQYKLLSIR